jgi:hypothetical protein
VRPAAGKWLVWIQGGMDADADDIARRESPIVEQLQRFIPHGRVAPLTRRGSK